MKVFVRSRMLNPDGGCVVRREHDQKPVQVQCLFLFIECIGYLFGDYAVIGFWFYLHDE